MARILAALSALGEPANESQGDAEWRLAHDGRVRPSLDKQLAAFLRRRRGGATYAQFARKLGISPSTLFRLENCEQSATVQVVQRITERLHCTLADIFPETRHAP
jgi:DNA-binding XRE family transcriptional regulator